MASRILVVDDELHTREICADFISTENEFEVETAGNGKEALEILEREFLDRFESIFVIGGGQVYSESIFFPECKKIYLTQISQELGCDTFFPASFKNIFRLTSQTPERQENSLSFSFQEYSRI